MVAPHWRRVERGYQVSTILDWLAPWYIKLALIAALLGGLLWLKHTYDVKVTKEAVNAALVSERAKTKPIIDGLKLDLATIKATSEAEAIKRKAELNIKTKEYQNALAQTKLLKAELDSKRLSNSEFERMLHASTDNNSATGAGISLRYDRIKTAHQQCERDLRISLDTAASTIIGLSKALAAVEALKLK